MRLTNVAQMDLVAGRVFSYGVRAAAANGRTLPVSFDQRRHVGAGQRPGSWMAVALRLPQHGAGLRDELSAAWDAVVARHGTLRTVFSSGESDGETGRGSVGSQPGSGRLALHEVDVESGVWQEHPVATGRRTREIVRDVFDLHCAPFERPSHRLCLVEPGEDAEDRRPEIVIGSDHAHVDMWSLVVVARELLTFLDDIRAARPPGDGLAAAPAFAEHTALLAQMPPAPGEVERRWANILEAGGGDMPVFPLPLGTLSPLPAEVVEVRDVLDAAGTDHLAALARERGVRLIAVGISVLTDVTARLAGQPLRAVFPVHSRYDAQWREAVGWFITNAVIECADPDPVACVAAVEEAIGLGSWPLAPILAPHGGMPACPGMFAVSWLDARRLPAVPDAAHFDLRHVSASIRTDGVMIWFAVNDAGLHLRCRYPDTPEARTNVGRWLDAIELGLREYAEQALAS